MPGEGKSGNWRSALFSFNVRPGSSEELAEAVVDCPPWAALEVGSGAEADGCDEVDVAVVGSWAERVAVEVVEEELSVGG